MKRSSVALLGVLSASCALVLASGCSDDDVGIGAGGSAGTAGTAGSSGRGGGGEAGASAGAAGSSGQGAGGAGGAQAGGGGGAVAGEGGLPNEEAGFGGAGLGGAPSQAGASGASTEAGSGGEGGASPLPCGPAFSKPDVPADIAVTSSAVLVAAYAAVGTQTYTCQASGTADPITYAWTTTSVPAAQLYGQSCTEAATHFVGPHWQANDGSIILGMKVRAVASATGASIQQLLLSAAVDGSVTGIFTSVTAVQRLDTVGGIAPSSGCDAAHVNGTFAVPYTANYYFYSGVGIIPTP